MTPSRMMVIHIFVLNLLFVSQPTLVQSSTNTEKDPTIRIVDRVDSKDDEMYNTIDRNTYDEEDNNGNLLTFTLQPLPHQHGRRTKKQQQQLIESALYLGYGTHYVEINVGYPNPKRQTLIVDTGSSNVAFPCASCFTCNEKKTEAHRDEGREHFDETESETYEFFLCGDCKVGECGWDDAQRRRRGRVIRRRALLQSEMIDGQRDDGGDALTGEERSGSINQVERRLLRSDRQTEDDLNRMLVDEYYDYDGDNQCHIRATYEEGSSWRAIESEDWAFFTPLSGTSHRTKHPTYHPTSPPKSEEEEEEEEEEEDYAHEKEDYAHDETPTHHPTQKVVAKGIAPSAKTELREKIPNKGEKKKRKKKKKKKDPNNSQLNTKQKMDQQFQKEVSTAKDLSTRRSLSYEEPWDDPVQFRLRFACQTNLTGLFLSQLADGIAGMDRSEYSLWNQMWRERVISKRQFSLCFTPMKERYYKSHGGILTVGGTDTRLHKNPMTYASIMTDTPWYTVYIRAIYLELPSLEDDGESKIVQLAGINATDFNSGEIIFDSGTTDIFLPKLMKDPFHTAWKTIMDEPYYDGLSSDDDSVYPNILLQMKSPTGKFGNGGGGGRVAGELDEEHPTDALYVIPPSRYKIKGRKSPMRMTEKIGDGGVLGAYAMMGHEILFDLESERVGFAESDCEIESLI